MASERKQATCGRRGATNTHIGRRASGRCRPKAPTDVPSRRVTTRPGSPAASTRRRRNPRVRSARFLGSGDARRTAGSAPRRRAAGGSPPRARRSGTARSGRPGRASRARASSCRSPRARRAANRPRLLASRCHHARPSPSGRGAAGTKIVVFARARSRPSGTKSSPRARQPCSKTRAASPRAAFPISTTLRASPVVAAASVELLDTGSAFGRGTARELRHAATPAAASAVRTSRLESVTRRRTRPTKLTSTHGARASVT